MIDRIYSQQLKKLLRQFPAVCMLGPRQCGKTTLAKLLQKESKQKIVYYDLEDPQDINRFRDPSILLNQLTAKTVIIDEIQRMPELFAVLRSVIDKDRKNGKFILLGSASPELILGVSETLAGRIAYIDATPFLNTELANEDSIQNRHWLRGGFPGSYLARSTKDARVWMNSFTRTFIERDLNTLFGITFSPSHMSRLWRMLAHHHGQLWNAASFSKGLDLSPVTVNRYIEYLEGAFMVRQLRPWHNNSGKRLTKTPKVYLRDSGVLHQFLGIEEKNSLINHPSVGYSWEGYVIEQICSSLSHVAHPYFYRTHDGAELDLVISRGLKPDLCIEIKFSSTPKISRGLTQSIMDLKCANNFIIVPDCKESWKIRHDVTVYGLYEFINKVLKKWIN